MNPKSLRFSGSVSKAFEDLEKLREIQAYCAHDLRSHIGATLGLLQVLADDPKLSVLKEHSGFQSALKSAGDALAGLDSRIPRMRPAFRVAWICVSRSIEGQPSADTIEGRLYVPLQSGREVLEKVNAYRPSVLFIDAASVEGDLSTLIRRVGPQLVKTVIFSHEPRPEWAPSAVQWMTGQPSWAAIEDVMTRTESPV